MKKDAKDFLGRKISIGDWIVYPGRQGSSLWMNLAEVTDITTYHDRWRNERLPCLKVLVRKTNWEGETVGWRNSTVHAIDRVTIIDDTFEDEHYWRFHDKHAPVPIKIKEKQIVSKKI